MDVTRSGTRNETLNATLSGTLSGTPNETVSATVIATPYATPNETVSQAAIDNARNRYNPALVNECTYNAVAEVTVLVPVRFTVPVQALDVSDACARALKSAQRGEVYGTRDWTMASPYYVSSLVHNGRRVAPDGRYTFRETVRTWLRSLTQI